MIFVVDVHLSKDGEVIVAHDPMFLRTAGLEGNIAETNYFDLPLLKEQLVLDFGTSKFDLLLTEVLVLLPVSNFAHEL